MPKLKRPGGDKQPVRGQFQCLGTGKDYRPSCLHRVGSQLHFNRIFLSTGQNHAGQPCACQLLHGASPKAARALPCFLSERCWQEKLSTTTGKCWGCFFSFLSTADKCMISFCPEHSKGIPRVWGTGNRPSEGARS